MADILSKHALVQQVSLSRLVQTVVVMTLALSAGVILTKSPDATAEVADLPSIVSECQEVATSMVVLPEEEEVLAGLWILMMMLVLLAVVESPNHSTVRGPAQAAEAHYPK